MELVFKFQYLYNELNLEERKLLLLKIMDYFDINIFITEGLNKYLINEITNCKNVSSSVIVNKLIELNNYSCKKLPSKFVTVLFRSVFGKSKSNTHYQYIH